MDVQDWLKNNKTIVIAAIIGITIIIVAALLRPPRYQKAGQNGNLILDTHSGRMLRPNGKPISY